MVKPRTRKVNTNIKHRSKQASIDMQIGIIQTLDVGLGVWTMTKTIGPRSGPNPLGQNTRKFNKETKGLQ